MVTVDLDCRSVAIVGVGVAFVVVLVVVAWSFVGLVGVDRRSTDARKE